MYKNLKEQDMFVDKRKEINERKIWAPIGLMRNGEGIKVGVIDDTFIDRGVLIRILRSTGFDVVGEATNGQDGLTMVDNEKPSIVFLDYVMPRMNGLTTLVKIKEKFPNIIVILVTSIKSKDMAVELIKEGASDYIVKPLDRKIVLSKVKKAVDLLGID